MIGIRQPLGAKKHLGQHFLRDISAIEKILNAVSWNSGEKIVEIGPGRGALTEPMYAKLLEEGRAQDLVLIEIDEDLLEDLRSRFPLATVVHTDAVHGDWKKIVEGKAWVLVSNLPYNVGTVIVNEAFWGTHPPAMAVVMLQKEVAERMVAEPPHMSLLSVALQLKTQGRRVCTVKPGAFVPPPAVDSVVLALAAHESYEKEHADRIISLAKKGFAHPRKQLRQTLAQVGEGTRESTSEILEKYGLSALARPEELPLSVWAALAEHKK